MICGNCQNECQRTCEAPNDCQNIECIESASCVCPDGFFVKGSDCVAPDRCRCYDEVENTIIQVHKLTLKYRYLLVMTFH